MAILLRSLLQSKKQVWVPCEFINKFRVIILVKTATMTTTRRGKQGKQKNIGFPTHTVAEAEMRLQDAFVTIHEQDMAAFEKDMNVSLAVSA